MLELRRLRLLHELALRGTIAAVAEALSYSPSTVSQQLSQLEREAGVPLLEPAGRRVQLTEQGHRLAAHAARVLELDESVRADLARASHSPVRVRIAVMPTVAQALVPAALTLLSERAPGLRLEVAEMAPEEALFELAARTFDLVVAEQYPGQAREYGEGVERTLLGVDPIRLAVPPGDPATGIADLRHRQWILEPRGAAVRQWAVQQCRSAGFEPDVPFESVDLIAHVRLVASGHAVAMLPDLVWSGDRASVQLLDLPGSPVREIFAASRASSRPNAGVAAARDALAEALARHEVR